MRSGSRSDNLIGVGWSDWGNRSTEQDLNRW